MSSCDFGAMFQGYSGWQQKNNFKKYIFCYSVHGGSRSFSVALYRLAVAGQQIFNCARRVFNIDNIANISLASSHYDNDKGVWFFFKKYIDKSVALCTLF